MEAYENYKHNRRNIDFIVEINESGSDIIEYDDDMESDEISYLNSLSAMLNVSDNDNEEEDFHENSLFEDYSPIDYAVDVTNGVEEALDLLTLNYEEAMEELNQAFDDELILMKRMININQFMEPYFTFS